MTIGFLHLDDEELPGNYGLKDQVAALRWVRDNIRAFGGDPTKITLAGQDSGAACVHWHMHSPLSKGIRSMSEEKMMVNVGSVDFLIFLKVCSIALSVKVVPLWLYGPRYLEELPRNEV